MELLVSWLPCGQQPSINNIMIENTNLDISYQCKNKKFTMEKLKKTDCFVFKPDLLNLCKFVDIPFF